MSVNPVTLTPSDCLLRLFSVLCQAASPASCLPPALPDDRTEAITVLGAGKAAGSMALALEEHWLGPVSGMVLVPYNHTTGCQSIDILEAAHPVPDDCGLLAAQRILQRATRLGSKDKLIMLLSGGASSLLSLPPPQILLEDKQQINRQLLRSGAGISEINCVRKHLSMIKGGRLAKACADTPTLTYAISDIPDDDLSVLGSGPTVADPTSSQQALDILQYYNIAVPATVKYWLSSLASESVKSTDACFNNNQVHVIATAGMAFTEVMAKAEAMGLCPINLGTDLTGEASELGAEHGRLALAIAELSHPTISPPCVLLSGGETTVTITGQGRGGRNSEYLLALATTVKGNAQITAMAADTDGIDGVEENAGALLTPELWSKAIAQQMHPFAMLANNDAYSFFKSLDALVVTGPTLTNVNDFRAIYISARPENS